MLEEYCTSHLEQVLQNGIDPWSKLDLHPTAQSFLDKLDLPSVNPYCTTPFHLSSVAMDMNESFAISNSSLGSSTLDELDLTMNDSFSESWSLLYPSLLMVVDLSFRLFASIIAPISIAYLLSAGVEGLFSISATSSASLFPRKAATNVNQKRKRQTALVDFIVCFAGLLSSTVILTDAMYVHHYGRVYGFSVFLTMVVLASQCAFRAKRARGFIVGLIAAFTLLVGSLIFHSEGEASVHQGFNSNGREFIVSYMKGSTIIKHQPIPSTTANDDSYPHPGIDLPPLHITEGLHYSQSNPIIHSIVNKWPEEKRSYDVNAGATPYTITGDARTGVPFLVKLFSAESITYNRVFLEVEDGEVVALDIALPQSPSGQLYHDYNKPVYLVLHGLNGGSNAPFIREFALRRNEEGSTVIVMIGRGLMDMPIRGKNMFHMARTDDVAEAAMKVRQSIGPNQILTGVGFSMGGIILSNYVARSGESCQLHAAIAVSGGLDLREQVNSHRSQRLWQPVMARRLLRENLIGKYGFKYKEHLKDEEYLNLLRAQDATAVDTSTAAYNGFNNVMEYYSEVSAMGDAPSQSGCRYSDSTAVNYSQSVCTVESERIANVSIPLCVLHALDDPIISWRSVVRKNNQPSDIVESGSGNVMILLTKSGGHVGWPVGWKITGWSWMNNLLRDFTNAVDETLKEEGVIADMKRAKSVLSRMK